jgi:hypothetical protein
MTDISIHQAEWDIIREGKDCGFKDILLINSYQHWLQSKKHEFLENGRMDCVKGELMEVTWHPSRLNWVMSIDILSRWS